MRAGSRSGFDTSAGSHPQGPRQAGSTSPAEGGSGRIAALSALVEELSGQIDAIQGASRREAIRRGVRQAAVRPEPPETMHDEVSAAVAERSADKRMERLGAIESRLAAIAERMAERDAPAAPVEPPRGADARGALGDLKAAIAEISARQETIDRASRGQLPTIDTLAIEDALQALRSDIAALDRRIAAEARRGEETSRSLRSEVAGLAAVPAGAGAQPAIAALAADLAAIREALDQAARETTLASIESGYGHMIERLDDIVRRVPERERLDALGHELARLADKVENAPRPREIDGELEDIRNAIASLAAGRHDDGLGEQVAELRYAIERIGRGVPSGDDLTRIEARLDAIADHLADAGELRHAVARLGEGLPSGGEIARIEARLDDVVQRLAGTGELHAAIARLAEEHRATDELGRIEERLDALAGRFDGSSERRLADIGLAIEKLAARPRESIDLTRIERDIGAMRREIDGFAKGTDPVALIRLEQQVAAIRTALEEKLPRHPDAGTAILGRLEQRLDALAGRFDALADLPNLLAPASGEAVTSLKAEISSLRDEVATRHPARLDEIEQQMRSLIGRIDDAALRDDGPALAALEAQVGQLADKLATIEPGSDALAKVETNLDRLQGLLADARRDTIETARATARTTVEEFAGALAGGRDDAMVAALREDLKRLQDAALRADQENQDTLEAVHDTLAKVVDRIAQLEAEDAGIAVGFGSIKERARNAIAPRLAAEDAPEDHRPLVPGSGKPDLTGAAPREEAAVPRPGDRKADFIAAARRAAQAAQAETARARAEDRKAGQDEGKPGPLARIGQALRSRRRPLVLAIAAVVLAIGAAKFGPALSYRVADALTPAKAERPVASVKEAPVDRSVTGSIAAKPVRAAEANPPAARLAAPAAASQPAAPLVAPKASSDAFAFSPDPFTDFLAAPAPKSGAIAVAAGPSGLDYARIEAAAAGGNAIAEFEMGRHLAEPEVGRADIKQAAIWYERAAKAGLPIAQYRLGSLYERGEGVKLDIAQAQAWYEKASLQGNARATHNLAVLISEGAAGKPDYKRAADLFIAAATMNVADSQYNLGVLYARGLGVPVDLVQSYKWFALAAQQGDSEAGKRRDEVAKALKDGDLATARLAVKAFEPKPLDPAANDEPRPDPAWYGPAAAKTAAGAAADGGDGSAG